MDLDQYLVSEGPAGITHDLPQPLIDDIQKCPSLRIYRDELIEGARVRQNLAILRQRMIGAATQRLRWFRKAGMRMVARIDPEHYHRLGKQYGYEAWHDKEFREDTLRHHPEMAVPEEKTSATFAVGGLELVTRNVRESQVYADEPESAPGQRAPAEGVELLPETDWRPSDGWRGVQGDPATALDISAHELPPPDPIQSRHLEETR